MEKPANLSKILADAPRNCWLALNEEETAILGHGQTIAEAVAQAREKGVEDPIIFWSPEKLIPAVY